MNALLTASVLSSEVCDDAVSKPVPNNHHDNDEDSTGSPNYNVNVPTTTFKGASSSSEIALRVDPSATAADSEVVADKGIASWIPSEACGSHTRHESDDGFKMVLLPDVGFTVVSTPSDGSVVAEDGSLRRQEADDGSKVVLSSDDGKNSGTDCAIARSSPTNS